MSKSQSAEVPHYSSEGSEPTARRAPGKSLRERLREFFFLRETEARTRALTPRQRSTTTEYYAAAGRRILAARDAAGRTRLPAALSLYREAALFLAIANLVANDPHFDPASLPRSAAFDRLHTWLETEGVAIPAEYDSARTILMSDSDLALDRLSSRDAKRRTKDLEIATQWLADLIETRTVREIRLARVLRTGIACGSALALVVYAVVWAVSPPNVARNKSVTSSSRWYDTTPEGAVNGESKWQFDFCSALEDQPWLAIDLGKLYAISRIVVRGRADTAFDQSIPLALEVSTDGVNYRKELERTTPFSDFEPWTIKPASLVTRFVRLRTLRNSVLVLNEVEVYGRPPKTSK